MLEKPAISIIVPVYNKKRYIERTLQKIQQQSFRDFECLLVDDGSTDGSGEICDVFAERDHRFKVFHIPNGGVSNARNLGLDQAIGDYITFVDADDEMHEAFLQNLYECAVSSQSPMVIGNLRKIWADRENTVVLSIPYQGRYDIGSLLPDFARIQTDTGIYGFCAAKLLKREIIGDLRFDCRIKLAEDLDFYLELYPKVDTVYFDTKPYYYYLQAAENSSMLDADAEIDYYTQLTIQLKIVRFLESKGCFVGNNRTIMTRRLYDYIYFCIYYCDIKDLDRTYTRIRSLDIPDRGSLQGMKLLQRILLFFYMHRMDWGNKMVLLGYRTLRKAFRRIR